MGGVQNDKKTKATHMKADTNEQKQNKNDQSRLCAIFAYQLLMSSEYVGNKSFDADYVSVIACVTCNIPHQKGIRHHR